VRRCSLKILKPRVGIENSTRRHGEHHLKEIEEIIEVEV
jgi:hypothetical protein